jgi:hypothetical protein
LQVLERAVYERRAAITVPDTGETVWMDFHQIVLACSSALNGAADGDAWIAIHGASQDEYAAKQLSMLHACLHPVDT